MILLVIAIDYLLIACAFGYIFAATTHNDEPLKISFGLIIGLGWLPLYLLALSIHYPGRSMLWLYACNLNEDNSQ